MVDLAEILNGHERIALDTAVFIYHLEQHPRYTSLTHYLFSGIEAGKWASLTSVITLMELTVRPWQLGRPDVAYRYESVLARFPNLCLLDVTRQAARQAAQLRAVHRLRPADAIQAATALIGGATLLVTNDRDMIRLSDELKVVVLEDLV
jgi:predicted nucleic acid-binding protein